MPKTKKKVDLKPKVNEKWFGEMGYDDYITTETGRYTEEFKNWLRACLDKKKFTQQDAIEKGKLTYQSIKNWTKKADVKETAAMMKEVDKQAAAVDAEDVKIGFGELQAKHTALLKKYSALKVYVAALEE